MNDIKLSIKEDSYDYIYNSNDKNNKKIICGDKKYFYDYYNKRLSCGIVWHNTNNMWWVISGGKLKNIASFELFDYENGLSRRKPVNKRKVEELLRKFESERNYKKCLNIQKYSENFVLN